MLRILFQERADKLHASHAELVKNQKKAVPNVRNVMQEKLERRVSSVIQDSSETPAWKPLYV